MCVIEWVQRASTEWQIAEMVSNDDFVFKRIGIKLCISHNVADAQYPSTALIS